MSLAFNTMQKQHQTMVIRIDREELDELPIDTVMTNLECFMIRLNDIPGITDVSVYRPVQHDTFVGELMQDGRDAYRLSVHLHPDIIPQTAQKRIEDAWEQFSKSANHVIKESTQAFYDADGNFDFYIGL